ncbi:restriction endonuclease subunit S [Aeromonas enteropelogenes]
MKAPWQVKNLGDVCHLIGGGTPPKDNADFYTGNIPWATVRDMRSDIITDTEYKITESAIKNSSTNIIPSGSVIIATRVGLGKVCLLNQDTAINQDLRGIFPKDEEKLSTRFLFWWLKSVAHLIVAEGTGATVQGVKLPFIKSLQIPLPPLPEQRRIVAILDEALAAITAARTHAEQNRQNARALFESYLQSVFSQCGDGWTEKPLGEMATFRNGVNFTKSSQGEPIKILGVKDFQDYYWAPLNSLDSIIPDGILPDSDTLQQNDIVFVRSNGNPELIGRCLLIGEVQERTTFSGFTIRARRFTEEVLPQYLCHFLKSSHIRRELVDGGNGANIRSLNQGALSKLRINFPVALSEQEKIVEQLETMQSETQHLESLYQRKIAALDELKLSLLQQAFSGQL